MASRTVHDVMAIVVSAAERPVIDNLLQLYLHDFSELARLGSPYGEVNEDGLFNYKPSLESYWQGSDHVPLMIRADGRIAGFALLNRWSALDRPLDRAVAESFILESIAGRALALVLPMICFVATPDAGRFPWLTTIRGRYCSGAQLSTRWVRPRLPNTLAMVRGPVRPTVLYVRRRSGGVAERNWHRGSDPPCDFDNRFDREKRDAAFVPAGRSSVRHRNLSRLTDSLPNAPNSVPRHIPIATQVAKGSPRDDPFVSVRPIRRP